MIDAVIILDDKTKLMEVNTGMLRMYRMPDNETALAYGFMAYSHQVNDVLLNQIIAETLKGIPQLVDWKARCPLTEDVFDAEISFHATRWNQTSAVIATVRDIIVSQTNGTAPIGTRTHANAAKQETANPQRRHWLKAMIALPR